VAPAAEGADEAGAAGVGAAALPAAAAWADAAEGDKRQAASAPNNTELRTRARAPRP